MATLNFAHREITAKIVYFGAKSAGSSTNVRALHERVDARSKGELRQFGAPGDAEFVWFFDYVPSTERPIKGFSVRFRVYAVPGGVALASYRREVLRGTDAVVFVADARRDCDQTNLDSLLDLEGLLREDGIDMAAIPMAIQVNHTDATDARPAEEVVFDLNPYGFPVIEAVARDAKGVIEAHEQVAGMTLARIQDALAGRETPIALTALHEPRRDTDEEIVAGHLEAIERATRERVEELSEDQGWAELQTAGEIEVAFQPADFAGTRPLQVLSASIAGETIELDVIMEKTAGGTARRLKVTLANRPTAAPPIPREQPHTPTLTPPERASQAILEALPASISLEAPPSRHDFPPLWYGLVGVGIGVVIGLLIGVITWM